MSDNSVVISGLSGRYPQCDNVHELRDALMNKVDLVSYDNRRSDSVHPEVPRRSGKIKNTARCDATFFGLHGNTVNRYDPQLRILLEVVFEALVDAGMNPTLLRGSKTGVFVGVCHNEIFAFRCFHDDMELSGSDLLGMTLSALANRISFFFGFNGPSIAMDTACSASSSAFDQAVAAIRSGTCDSAIVGGVNFTYFEESTRRFYKLGVLSKDGRCKTFDEEADGFARADACVAVLLQRSKDAKRIYAEVVHSKINCDGYKNDGITFPSRKMQKQLFAEIYEECGVDPSTVDYVEAHGTGTRVGDVEEVNAIADVFCKNRASPLLIGSVKTNMGHTEGASGLCSLSKVLITMETGIIPPNLHFKTPKTQIAHLLGSKLQVVTEKTPLQGRLVAFSSFGFGGSNSHVLLRANNKKKTPTIKDGTPRLVVISGRTEEFTEKTLAKVEGMPLDDEYLKLLSEVYSEHIPGYLFRAFSVLGATKPSRNIQYFSGKPRKVWFVFSGMGSQWAGMGNELLSLPVFADAVKKCHKVLKPRGLDIYDIITREDETIFDNILNSFVGIAVIQVGLVDVLTSLGIQPDGIIGHSVGELGCAYADGCFKAEEMVLAAYYRGIASLETPLIKGSMAAVGLSYDQVKDLCPPDVDVACHNGPDSSTISGPSEVMKAFVKSLQEKGVFAREVNTANIAYHSRYIAKAGPLLKEYLNQVIKNPRPRSERWISSSVPEDQWKSPLAQYSSADYHTNNLLSPVLFEEASRHIPSGVITIEIAPHGLLQAILKRSLPKDCINVSLTSRRHHSNIEHLLCSIGKLYLAGLQPQTSTLYPDVEYPVSRGTPMISPIIEWDHSEENFVPRFDPVRGYSARNIVVDLKLKEMKFYEGHRIDGKILFPATGYLCLAWETFQKVRGSEFKSEPVIFENVRFLRATVIQPEGKVKFTVTLMHGSGAFEVSEGGSAVVTGKIFVPADVEKEMSDLPPAETEHTGGRNLKTDDMYKEFRLRGYNYSGMFKGIMEAEVTGKHGLLRWKSNWVSFLDTMMQLGILQDQSRALLVPTSVKRLIIDTKKHLSIVGELQENEGVESTFYEGINVVKSGGIEIQGLKTNFITRRGIQTNPVMEKYEFVPYLNPFGEKPKELVDVVRLCVHVVLENMSSAKIKVAEVPDGTQQLLSPIITEVVKDLPLVQPDVTIFKNSVDLSKLLPENGFRIEETFPKGEAEFDLTIISGFSKCSDLTFKHLKEGSFAIVWEKGSNPTTISINAFHLESIVKQSIGDATLHLLRKVASQPNPRVVRVTEKNFDWLEEVKAAVEESQKKKGNVLLVAQHEAMSGILGLINCIRREPNGTSVRCVFIRDSAAPEFSLTDPFFRQQLLKDLAMNVYEEGLWGSYRHLPFEDSPIIHTEYAYLNTLRRGDLSSLRWIQSPLSTSSHGKINLCDVYFSALNFRDIMLATGRLAAEDIVKDRLEQECVLGIEFSGRNNKGERVMGVTKSRGLATKVEADENLIWNIPDGWSMEDAATVPCVYATVYYALIIRGYMQPGESILIHAGSGGVGQAAISVALHMKCTVYTTVGSQEKRDFLKETFPQLTDNNIFNSRDTKFEHKVLAATKYKGVDLVLNSLSEDKLKASVSCLAQHGRFLEIGKFDILNDHQLGLNFLSKDCSLHGVMLDILLDKKAPVKKQIHDLLAEGIKSGAVRPLTRTVFSYTEAEQAFRFMASGKHIGKVLLRMRDEERPKIWSPLPIRVEAVPKFFCNPNHTHVIIGGLGGFGLELADWLVVRGAKNVVLTSRTGVRHGYQELSIRRMREAGVNVGILTHDVTALDDATKLLTESNRFGPVGSIFNLAVVLNDSILKNQSKELFQSTYLPKATATKNLDVLSRKLCPELQNFVVFSSVSCGRGNAGQSNYGMANSVMERVCEQRRREGLPGLAIQWGAVGDVGIVAEMQGDKEIAIGGTLPQRIASCLQVLDRFLVQQQPVVSSMVVSIEKVTASKGATGDDATDALAAMLGIKDIRKVIPEATLPELGMDSLVAVEIKQLLERDFEIFLTSEALKSLTFSKLAELSNSSSQKEDEKLQVEDFNITLAMVAEEFLSSQVLINLSSVNSNEKVPVFFFPGLNGLSSVFRTMAKSMKHPAFCVQFVQETPTASIEDAARYNLKVILAMQKEGPYYLIGHSFGGAVALELGIQLEKSGHKVNVCLLDTSPIFMRCITQMYFFQNAENGSYNSLQLRLLADILNKHAECHTKKVMKELSALSNWEDRVQCLADSLSGFLPISKEDIVKTTTSLYDKIKMMLTYESKTEFHGKVVLVKPTKTSSWTMEEEDYGLSKICKQKPNVYVVEGNHDTMLENSEVAGIINRYLSKWVNDSQ